MVNGGFIMDSITFQAEIKKASARKTASLDKVYQIVFETEDPMLMNLSTVPADILVKVVVSKVEQ